MKENEIIPDLLAKNKYTWLHTAESLFTASQIIYAESSASYKELMADLEVMGSVSPDWYPEANTHLVARMLIGMAIENLIKGLIIQRFPEKVINGKLQKPIAQHFLDKLILQLPDIQLSNEETKILGELTESILWRGRFPVPMKVEKYVDAPNIDNEILTGQNLYNKLKAKLQNEN